MLKYVFSIKDNIVWKTCLQIAKANPKLFTEEVEFKAALIIQRL